MSARDFELSFESGRFTAERVDFCFNVNLLAIQILDKIRIAKNFNFKMTKFS